MLNGMDKNLRDRIEERDRAGFVAPPTDWPETGRAIILFAVTGLLALVRFRIHGDPLTIVGSVGAIAAVLVGAGIGVVAEGRKDGARLFFVCGAICWGIIALSISANKMAGGTALVPMLYQVFAHCFVGWLLGYGWAGRRPYMLILATGLIIVEVAAFTLGRLGMLD